MSEPLEALREYVHCLHEREGVRHIRLNRSAQEGLARLAANIKPQTEPLPVAAAVRSE